MDDRTFVFKIVTIEAGKSITKNAASCQGLCSYSALPTCMLSSFKNNASQFMAVLSECSCNSCGCKLRHQKSCIHCRIFNVDNYIKGPAFHAIKADSVIQFATLRNHWLIFWCLCKIQEFLKAK